MGSTVPAIRYTLLINRYPLPTTIYNTLLSLLSGTIIIEIQNNYIVLSSSELALCSSGGWRLSAALLHWDGVIYNLQELKQTVNKVKRFI